MVNFQNLKVVQELVEVENGKGKYPHILHGKPPTEEFIFPLISFSGLLASSFLNFYRLI